MNDFDSTVENLDDGVLDVVFKLKDAFVKPFNE